MELLRKLKRQDNSVQETIRDLKTTQRKKKRHPRKMLFAYKPIVQLKNL